MCVCVGEGGGECESVGVGGRGSVNEEVLVGGWIVLVWLFMLRGVWVVGGGIFVHFCLLN